MIQFTISSGVLLSRDFRGGCGGATDVGVGGRGEAALSASCITFHWCGLAETVATDHHGIPSFLLQPRLGWLYSSDVRAPAIHSKR